MTRIGITGAGGYLGTAVATLFEEREYELVRTARTPGINEVKLDVRNRARIAEVFQEVDAIIHCAAVVGSECEDDRDRAFSVNVQGTENVAWWCRERAIPLVFVSSVAAVADYSDPVDGRLAGYPEGIYGLTKAMSERDIVALARNHFSAHVLRLSNVYGDFAGVEDSYSLVANLIEDAVSEGELTIRGSGYEQRDLIHVSDAAEGIYQSIETLLHSMESGARVFPLGSGQSRSIREIARAVMKSAENEVPGVSVSLKQNQEPGPAHPKHVEVDTALAREFLDQLERKSFEGTLAEMIRRRSR